MVSNDMMEYKNACLLKRLRKPAGCVDVVIDTDTYHLVYSLLKCHHHDRPNRVASCRHS